MMRTLLLALRNLLRNRRRSLATVAAVGLGSASILLFGGYSANIRYSMETAYARTGGHLQIQHRDFLLYGNGNPTAYGIKDANVLLERIRGDAALRDALVVATPTLQFGGIAGNYAAGVSRTVVGVGLVAQDHSRMREWNHYDIPLISPPFKLTGSRPEAAIIGVGVARVLQLCAELKIALCPAPEVEEVAKGAALPSDIAQLTAAESKNGAAVSGAPASGQRIELLASTARGTPNVASLEVIDAEGQGFKELDEVYIAVHLAQAQRLVYGASASKVTAIMLQLKRPDMLPAAQSRLNEMLPQWSGAQPLTVLDLETLNPFFVQTVQLFATIFGFIFTLIGGIVLFTVSNTMNTAVVERTVEIGTLRAMGLRQAGIRQLFVAEGVVLGMVGAVTGALLALLTATLVNALGLEWMPPGSAEPLPLVLRVWGEWSTIVGVTLGLIAVATVSAWWPAYRAARLNVVDALRHV
jgi:putative ABC transport system permease protein